MERSPFARLPAELREHIYTLALHQLVTIVFSRRDHWPEPHSPGLVLNAKYHVASPYPLALVETCRALRSECLPLFCHINAFRLQARSYIGPCPPLCRFLDLVGPRHSSALRSVEVTLDDADNVFDEHAIYHCRDEMEEQLTWLRRWCLVRPRVEVRVVIGRPSGRGGGEAVRLDLRRLVFTCRTDPDGGEHGYRVWMLEGWMQRLRTMTGKAGVAGH